MQTSPCGHRVVCRRCFVKTIQSAVAQRLLPLRCVICRQAMHHIRGMNKIILISIYILIRARINRLTSSSGSWRIQESASSYSMGTTKSWSVSSNRRGFHKHILIPILSTQVLGSSSSSYSVGARVAQSTSLYSMSSGSSCVSGKCIDTYFL